MPDKSTKSISHSHTLILGSKIPVVHSINSIILEKEGWVKAGNEYHKEGYVLKYDGVKWSIGGERFIHMEDLPK